MGFIFLNQLRVEMLEILLKSVLSIIEKELHGQDLQTQEYLLGQIAHAGSLMLEFVNKKTSARKARDSGYCARKTDSCGCYCTTCICP
jgi:hypothetical protein